MTSFLMPKRRSGWIIPYDNRKPYAAFMLVMHEASIGLFYCMGEAETGDDAGITHNRRACSALQGLGGLATNKHMRLWLPKTLLATAYHAYGSDKL